MTDTTTGMRCWGVTVKDWWEWATDRYGDGHAVRVQPVQYIVAETAGQAKTRCSAIEYWDAPFTDLRARRYPAWDGLTQREVDDRAFEAGQHWEV